LRIVELLNDAPRAVGEIALRLGLRQPQVTKHLQTLERAGLVTVHPLGQRRIYALRRQPLRELADWLAGFDPHHPSESVLDQYAAAIAAEQQRADRDPSWATGRTVRVRGSVPARAESVWAYWTDAALIRRWWSPEHFVVAECEADPVPGGLLRIVMEEGDGTRHTARGRYVALEPPRALSFELAPLDAAGKPLFSALHRLRLTERDAGTALSLEIDVDGITPAAAPALAGLQIGWRQLLGTLAAEVAGSGEDSGAE
jgi:uncharacterized protein YndB with AHSA1/START domain